MADRRHKDRQWNVADDSGVVHTWEEVIVAVLMDLRDELRQLNTINMLSAIKRGLCGDNPSAPPATPAPPAPPAQDAPKLLRVREVAKALGIHELTVRRLIASGALPSVRLGRKIVRVPADAVTAYLHGKGSAK